MNEEKRQAMVAKIVDNDKAFETFKWYLAHQNDLYNKPSYDEIIKIVYDAYCKE